MTSVSSGLRGLMERVDELLEVTYRSADLGNFEDPLEETVYILLSRQTRESCYQTLYRDLRLRYPRWLDVEKAPLHKLETLLRPGGFQKQRARQLVGILGAVHADNVARGLGPASNPSQDLTLDYLRGMPEREAERFLVKLPGIGPKSARCVMAYSLAQRRFAVDTNIHRIFERLGAIPMKNRKLDHDPLEQAVPQGVRKRLHINMVHHGRAICRSTKPRCEECVLVSFCSTGQTQPRQGAQPVAVELFAGAGGLGTGFRKEGYRIALAVELDRHAAQTYRANHPGVPVLEQDVTALSAARIRKVVPGLRDVDVVLAGPPCQGYSAAGRREASDSRNRLFSHVSRIAKELNARYIVIENVPGLRKVGGIGFLRGVRASLSRRGYRAREYLLNAADFGLPQVRKRFIFLGRRSDLGPPPPGPPLPRSMPETARLKAALNAVPELPSGTQAEYLRWPDGRIVLNGSTMAHSAEVIKKIHRIKPGGGPISYRRLGNDVAPTLIAGHRALPVHPRLDRTISVREAACIQGFEPSYVFCGPRSTQPLQVANAVPPAVAGALAAHLKALLAADRATRSSKGSRHRAESV